MALTGGCFCGRVRHSVSRGRTSVVREFVNGSRTAALAEFVLCQRRQAPWSILLRSIHLNRIESAPGFFASDFMFAQCLWFE
jgi:hypothetical protein